MNETVCQGKNSIDLHAWLDLFVFFCYLFSEFTVRYHAAYKIL